MTTAPETIHVVDLIEAQCRKVMAERVKLKVQPGTHGDQADLLAEVDALLDQWLHQVSGQARLS